MLSHEVNYNMKNMKNIKNIKNTTLKKWRKKRPVTKEECIQGQGIII